jgi:hypothetical protein
VQFTDDLSCPVLSPESYCNATYPIPDFTDFSLRASHDSEVKSQGSDPHQAAAHGLCELAANHPRRLPAPRPSMTRKRGRESVDLSLQHNVRNLLSTPSGNEDDGIVLPDSRVADSFLLQTETTANATQPPPSARLCTSRLALQKDMGRKRACCGGEATMSITDRTRGPGMWEGVL